MNVSRKDFFKKSLYSLGEAVYAVTGALKGTDATPPPDLDARDFTPVEREEMYAVPFNEHCLARNCGCFACVERCEKQAIMVIPGTGIRIDERLCTGCGTCEYVCPVTPKAIRLLPRQ